MSVVVAGGAGFIGSHLVERLLGDGHQVVVLDNLVTGRLQNLQSVAGNPRLRIVEHDICRPPDLSGPFDAVLHLASPASPSDFLRLPLEILEVGSTGTRNMLELAAQHGARFLFASTSEVYGDPLVHPQPETYFGNVDPIGPRGCYDESKRFGEALTMAYHRARGVDAVIVRIFNTYGPRMRPDDGRVLSTFITQALRGEPLTVHGDGSQTRSYCYVADLVGGLLAALASGGAGPYNLGATRELSVLDLARAIVRAHRLDQRGDHHAAAVRTHRRSAAASARPHPHRGRMPLAAQHHPRRRGGSHGGCPPGRAPARVASGPMSTKSERSPAAAAPFVRVVVVNFDGGEVTRRCVDALLATQHPTDRLEIVVVDNASVDGLNWVLREEYPQVRLIESDVNEGFARGCNLAMRDLDGVDFVALINNDAIVEPDWLAPLVARMDDPTVGAVSPKLLLNVWAHAVVLRPARTAMLDEDRPTVGVHVTRLDVDGVDVIEKVRFDERFWPDHPLEPGRWSKGDAAVWWAVPDDGVPAQSVVLGLSAPASVDVEVGTPDGARSVTVGTDVAVVELATTGAVRILNSAGGGLYAGWFGGDRGFLEPDLGQYDQPEEVFSWCGGAVLLRSDYLRDVGIFDPTYFLYYEDFDLSWRGRSSGWRYLYEPTSRVFHEHAYSSKAGSDFFTFWVERNRRLTLIKNAPAGVAFRGYLGCLRTTIRFVAEHVYHRLRRLRPPSPTALKAICKPIVSLTRATPAALRERRRLERRRTVSNADIQRWTLTK